MDWGLNKMSVTMKDVELVFADKLSPEQLMVDDIIKFDDEFLTIKLIYSLDDGGYAIEASNDFDDDVEIWIDDEAMIEWYVYRDEEIE